MPAILTAIALYFWELVKTWGALFAAPFTNFEMLWVIIPAYLDWAFADFFQEKRGTSLGNAISNSVLILWASLDWVRSSLRFFSAKVITTWHLVGNISVSVAVFLFGGVIIYTGIKGKGITHHIGRIRVVTYIILMITPLVYNSNIPLGKAIIAMILFFPVYYYIIELIEHLLPDPASITEDEKANSPGAGTNFDSGFSNDISNPSMANNFSGPKNQNSNQNSNFNDFRNFKL